MAGGLAGVFGLVHDLKDRTRQRKVRDAKRNYLADPLAAIQEVNEWDPDEANALRQDYEKTLLARQAMAEKQQSENQTRYKTALGSMVQGLRKVKQEGGDLNAAFDQLTPVFQSGFGMQPEEINQWREKVTADPSFLDTVHGLLTKPEAPKWGTAGPGSVLYNESTGEVGFRNPAAPRTVKMKHGDGREDLYVVDEEGNLVQSSAAPSTAMPGTGAPVGPGAPNPGSRGNRNGNPGNIKDGPWARSQPGYIGSDGTFAKFAPGYGARAQETLLDKHYVNGQRSTRDIVMKYLGGAANPENSSASQQNYVSYVARRIGLDPNAPVSKDKLPVLAQAMREFENGETQGGGARPVASTTGKPVVQNGWRRMTAQERAQYPNLDPNREYQVGIEGDNANRIVEVPGQARPKGPTGPNGGKPGTLTMASHEASVRNLSRVRDEARALRNDKAFEQATGSIQGQLPSLFQSTRDFDDRLGSFVGRTVVGALLAMKQNSPNGATGFGSMNKTEGEWVKDSQGSFRQTSPDILRKSLKEHENDAMISIGMAYNIPPDATRFLLQNPKTANQFDKMFGAGMARRIRGF